MMVLWLLAALYLAALAACSQATDAGIPSAGESQEAEPTASAPAPADAALTYSQCMREHGLTEFPDADAEGRIKLKLGTIDPDAAVFRSAGDACRHLAPEGWGDAAASPGDAEVMLEFARCLRANGVPEYPDPDPNAGLQIRIGPGSALDPNDPKVKTALESCEPLLQKLQSGPRIGG